MKKWWIIPLALILLVVTVDAKCGDNFCDYPIEDCSSCADDCVCTRDAHGDPVSCAVEFTAKECEKGYCKDKWCSSLEGFTSLFQKSACYENGSVSLTIKFQELDSYTLTPGEDLKVYMKLGDDATFEEIKGIWFNPSKEGDYRYTKIRDTSSFYSDADLFKTKGDYWVRVKYVMGRNSNLFEDKKISCPGMPVTEVVEAPVEEVVEEPEEEVVEEPEEIPVEEPAETPTEQIEQEPTPEEPESKKDLILYAIIVLIIFGVIVFFVKYELKVIRKV